MFTGGISKTTYLEHTGTREVQYPQGCDPGLSTLINTFGCPLGPPPTITPYPQVRHTSITNRNPLIHIPDVLLRNQLNRRHRPRLQSPHLLPDANLKFEYRTVKTGLAESFGTGTLGGCPCCRSVRCLVCAEGDCGVGFGEFGFEVFGLGGGEGGVPSREEEEETGANGSGEARHLRR
jgi:hypothetical protein